MSFDLTKRDEFSEAVRRGGHVVTQHLDDRRYIFICYAADGRVLVSDTRKIKSRYGVVRDDSTDTK